MTGATGMYRKVESFRYFSIPKEHRVCGSCGRKFQSGTFKTQRGYVVEATCSKCENATNA